ncbi:Flavin-containing monooxygenase [Quillaja saponaria]|uniref:Flavin-containing monooxygenase n=1 Tax=Quillaja saponaria TaxID=32244 RepID=A0AAD7LWN5_QUISA|nr:Flavin-containing monooxygenase [Quillaja saponaria]
MEEEVPVVIVGAGPAGLATSACLNRLSISNIVLERDDCYAPLWKKRTYDRLKLHLAKQYCQLPHMPFPSNEPTFVSKTGFLRYLDNYVARFRINIRYNRYVESAFYGVDDGKWHVVVRNSLSKMREVYVGKFLVVATGENDEGFIPKFPGLDSFKGNYMHSSKYENGKEYKGKNVLVVGSGNSGLEIAYDLSEWGAKTSIVARSPVHVLTKEIVLLGMFLLIFLPLHMVDKIAVMLSKLKHGNLSKYGLQMPKKGPFFLKATTGRSPTIDVGSIGKIKKGEIKVFPSVSSIKEDKVIEFADGRFDEFDTIIFATGYKSTVLNWLKDYKNLFHEGGMPKRSYPNHWKGGNSVYCAGFARRGLDGIASDAQKIADHISFAYYESK